MKTKQVWLLLVFIVQISIVVTQFVSGPYAFWAHSHVVWINANDQNQSQMYRMVQNYKKYQIPVGGVNIDSGWAQHYSDFIWNKKKFPNPQQMVDKFHLDGMKAILWVTSIVNNDSQLFQEGLAGGYFLNHGKVVKWWHGHGAFVDFLNPAANAWYEKQMDKILDLGFDGWKCDGSDPIIALLKPWPYSPHKKRQVGIHEYGHLYYGTFYNHTKQKNPNALIMARPVDSFQNKLYFSYAPKYVMFSGWVGDQHADFDGLRQAAANVLHSAWKGYLNFGFDIGGYKTSPHSSRIVFIRWAQLGALVPFMENGGGGIHQPWLYDEEITRIYRNFVYLHYELSSFFYTAGIQNYKKHKSVLKPLAKRQIFVALSFPQTFGYIIDGTFLVFPILSQNGIAQMQFPKGTWIYYFDHQKKFFGPSTITRTFSLQQLPLFIKPNSIYPIDRSYLQLPYIHAQNQLPRDEIVFVYLKDGSLNRTFYHQNFTDYLSLSLNKGQCSFNLKRFNKNITQDSASSQMQIRIVGLSHFESIKITQISDSSTKYIQFQKDKADMVFSYSISNKIKIQNIQFKLTELLFEEQNDEQLEDQDQKQIDCYEQEDFDFDFEQNQMKLSSFFQQISRKLN